MLSKDTSGIYEIICLVNNKSYIGESKSINHRWKHHKYKLKDNTHDNRELQKDYNLYGDDNFQHKVLLELPDDKNTRLLEEAKKIRERLENGQDVYNKQLTIDQIKMLIGTNFK